MNTFDRVMGKIMIPGIVAAIVIAFVAGVVKTNLFVATVTTGGTVLFLLTVVVALYVGGAFAKYPR